MRRLVLCCDGTWNHAVNPQVSNIEKLARAVRPGLVPGADGRPDAVQVVGYVGGVGSRGYTLDRLVGGAFGYGFTRNVVEGYRFLAMNYAPGDEIVVIGYSRGAYTARSVVGMISQVGLLTPEAVDAGLLCEAERVYRLRADDGADGPAAEAVRREKARFKAEHSWDAPVRFLGVFDTVGALGVPVLSRRKHRFHDVRLSPMVQTARQALAIDERRITFAPCLWDVPDDDEPGRVEQVWFPGTHGDVGGGGARCGLSDLALRWMADELAAAGVVLDERRLASQTSRRAPLLLHQDPPWFFRLVNGVKRLRPRYERVDGRVVFRRGLRVLALPRPDGGWRDGVLLADTALRHVVRDDYLMRAPNLGWWVADAGGVEHVPTEHVRAARGDLRPLVPV
ncbi:DUF2235 domain-containing protein [Isoptericola variabilis]|uniref:T6SS Phospholipase effector Tle1-like catalytic domain-containing protein n=1 Tax=Isoptericola variabilis (strain 225) TaxID=743718 RepID=F6FPC1_ISOV2|nr:DUF2235 domain-containing protein [Isoptericola variabilis]AEG43634.1 Protein of unknown function DUF2235 [Isoptericola variabilis 225]TWH31996.1 uncharacterized protein (DUF2235 family) [Isoptericola variabilis J7]